MKGPVSIALSFAALLSSSSARAQDAEGCSDTWPEDRNRPALKESFPLTGTAGHVVLLDIEVRHLPGERVFPAGIQIEAQSDEMNWLTSAHFQVPSEESTLSAVIERPDKAGPDGRMMTRVRVPLVPLPAEPGRVELTLPRLPIAVSRASGQVHTICTDPHVITVEDPLASIPNPEKKPDPQPRPQEEVWETMRDAVLSLLAALPVAAALVWLILYLRKKWKKAPKPPPPRPPWEVAFAELDALERRGLLQKQEYEEFLDVVSDTLRKYLGERYGFDGLESTTRETLRKLARLAPDFDEERAVRTILQRADLVKFARNLPTEEECKDALSETRRLVRITTRAPTLDPRGGPPPASPPPGSPPPGSPATPATRERRSAP